MQTSISTLDRRQIHVPQGVSQLRLLIPSYPSFSAGPNQQQVDSCVTSFSLDPSSLRTLTDGYGNHYTEAIWYQPQAGVLTEETRAEVTTALRAAAPAKMDRYPITASLPADVQSYLKPTALTPSDDPRIKTIADEIMARPDLKSESAVIDAVISWIVDHVQYQFDAGEYDALTTLERHGGECTGYAHLAIAILRAAGIPARFVAGMSFQQPYNVTGPGQTLAMTRQSLSGFLYHAWIQAYFPTEGWVEYDPQGDFGFVDSRRIVFSVGPDKASLPEGRFINTVYTLPDPASFSEQCNACVMVNRDNVQLEEAAVVDRGPLKSGVYLARAGI